MEESFQLLSSMSPKPLPKHVTARRNRAPSKLALNRSIRRSACFDKLVPTSRNVDVIENSSETSSDAGEPIVISDSEDEEHKIVVPESNFLSNTKLDMVQKWISKIDFDLSTVSTIHGELVSKGLGVANSTFIDDSDKIKINELFRNKMNLLEESQDRIKSQDKIESQNAIKSIENEIKNDTEDKENLFIFKTPKVQKESVALLDELYGNEWRKKYEPKTEPKPKTKEAVNKSKVPHTECKPKKKSAASKPNSLLQTINTARRKAALESPWMERLKTLCDSESDGDETKLAPVKLSFSPKNLKEDKKINVEPLPIETMNDYKKTIESEFESWQKNFEVPKNTERKVDSKLIKNFFDSSGSDDESNKKNNPRKALTKALAKLTIESSSSDEDYVSACSEFSSTKPLSFLASLSKNVPAEQQCDASARIYKSCYKQHKEELSRKLFALYNEKIFGGKLPADLKMEWSARMTGTAGNCYCMKIKRRTGKIERVARFMLASKVLDSADRLRDTLVHEMCHAAAWIINEVNSGHGAEWKAWAAKAMRTFPELPPIKRCHEYAIETKYTYKCENCGYQFGRHTKSLDTSRKRCGYCYGKFEVFINKTNKAGETRSMPSAPRKTLSAFAAFVKDHYADYKADNLKHAEVMKILGQKYKERNAKQPQS